MNSAVGWDEQRDPIERVANPSFFVVHAGFGFTQPSLLSKRSGMMFMPGTPTSSNTLTDFWVDQEKTQKNGGLFCAFLPSLPHNVCYVKSINVIGLMELKGLNFQNS